VVTASAWNPPWSNYAGDCSSTVLLELSNGARLLYNGSWCAKGTWCDWNGNWQIECQRGTVTYANGEINRLDVPELYEVKGEEIIPHITPDLQGQSHVLHDFRDAISSGRKPKTDCTDNIRSVAMVFATVEAMKTGRTVDVITPDILALLD
jgi:predicted dehydrogenase